MKPFSRQNRWLRKLQIGLLGTAMFAFVVGMGSVSSQRSPFPVLTIPVAQAQPTPMRRVDPTAISARIYEQVPSLPLENQYVSSRTNRTAEDNTLVSRIIRYHLYNKERPTNFRFDWKLTIADYLGAFDRMSAGNYADYGLRDNPLDDDVSAVQSLSREERDRLVDALYVAFTTPAESE